MYERENERERVKERVRTNERERSAKRANSERDDLNGGILDTTVE